MPQLQFLKDNFNDGTIDTAKWTAFTGGTGVVQETGGLLEMVLSAGSINSAGIQASGEYVFTDSFILAEISLVTSSTAESNFGVFDDTIGSSDQFYWKYTNGTLMAGMDADAVLITITYNATTHRWWKIRDTSNTIYWETSEDGIEWTTRATYVHSRNLSNYVPIIYAATPNIATPGEFHVDNVNSSPQQINAELTGTDDTTAQVINAELTGVAITPNPDVVDGLGLLPDGAGSGMLGQGMSAIYEISFDETNDINAQLTGTDTTSSDSNAQLTGQDSITDDINAEVTGTASDTSDRNSELTGSPNGVDDINAELTGFTPSEGIDDVNSELTGTDTDNSDINAEITGSDVAEGNINAELTGTASDTNDINAQLTGTDTSTADRNAELTGSQPVVDDINAELHGTDTISADINAELEGMLGAASNINSELTGTAQITADILAELTGVATATADISAELTGAQPVTSDINSQLTGVDTAQGDINAEITGVTTASSTINSQLTGYDTAQTTISAELYGIYRDVRTTPTGGIDNPTPKADIDSLTPTPGGGPVKPKATNSSPVRPVAGVHN